MRSRTDHSSKGIRAAHANTLNVPPPLVDPSSDDSILNDPVALQAYREGCQADPVGWLYTAMGVNLWSKQREVVEAVRDRKFVSVRSANGVGKSYCAAAIVVWYLLTRSPGYAILTSSAWTNIIKVLWPEIRRILGTAPCKALASQGRLLSHEWKLGEQWGAFSVSAKRPENFAGFRTPNGCLIVADEASFLDEDIHDAAMGLASAHGSRILYIGNPLRADGPFFRTFTNADWYNVSISAYDSPNVVSGEELVPGLCNSEWIREREIEWGREHPSFHARVLGEFPIEGDDTLITLFDVERAVEKGRGDSIKPTSKTIVDGYILPENRQARVVLGVDVARFGSDRTVIIARRGSQIVGMDAFSREDSMQVVRRVRSFIERFKPSLVNVDDIGIGGGVVDRLKEIGFRQVNGVNVSSPPRGTDVECEKFANLRAQSWWAVREWVKTAAIPDHSMLKTDLCAPKYGYDSSQRILIEPKQKTKDRLGRSPDFGDALMLSLVPEDRRSIYAFIS